MAADNNDINEETIDGKNILGGRRLGLTGNVDNDVIIWFQCDRQFLSACMDDLCWMLLRLSHAFVLRKQQTQE